MEEQINKKYFQTIREARDRGKLVVFVGAGVSCESGFPSWREMIESMKKGLNLPEEDNDYLKIAEYYYLQYGQHTYYKTISDFFSGKKEPNELHKLIIDLCPQHIITTNIDNLLEKAIQCSSSDYLQERFVQNGSYKDLQQLYPKSVTDIYSIVATDQELQSSSSNQYLLKMHGDLGHKNIVFKESDYFSYSENFPLIETFVKSLFLTNVVVFVGYSFNDNNLKMILNWIKIRTKNSPPLFMIWAKESIFDSEREYLKNNGIHVLLDMPYMLGLVSKEKGKITARILSKIASPSQQIDLQQTYLQQTYSEQNNAIDIVTVLYGIVSDTMQWKVIYPYYLIKLLKNRLNTTEINKVYHDSEIGKGIIVYNLNEEEKKYNRSLYRKIRKQIKNILRIIPIAEVHLVFSVNPSRFICIKNKLNLNDETNDYISFNVDESLVQAISAKKRQLLEADPEQFHKFAFDNYYLNKFEEAQEYFKFTSNIYYEKSLFVKSLLSAFNRRQIFFGDIPLLENMSEFLRNTMEEQLYRNDSCLKIKEKLPQNTMGDQAILSHGLNFENTFLLEMFRDISLLCRKIESEINKKKSGWAVFSNSLNSLWNKVYCLTVFILENKIAVIHSSEYKNIAKISFESILKVKTLYSDGLIEIDKFTLFWGIISFNEKDLLEFLNRLLEKDEGIALSDDTYDYAFCTIGNLLKTICSSKDNCLLNNRINLWSNVITILSYVEHDEKKIEKIFNYLIQALDSSRWFEMSDIINRFLVVQANKCGVPFSIDIVKPLFYKLMENLNFGKYLPIREKGVLFSNLLYIVGKSDDKENFIEETEHLNDFLLKIQKMPFDEKLRAVDLFVFPLYSLAVDDFRQKRIAPLLTEVYKESEARFKTEREEKRIILGLHLYYLGILDKIELITLLKDLKDLVAHHKEKKSGSSDYFTIQELLLRIDIKGLIKDSEALISGVKEIINRMKGILE